MIKILHVSHNSLPDWRVEKSALTGRKFGYEPYFAGPSSKSYDRQEIFARIFVLPWESNAALKWWARGSAVGNPLYWFAMKKHINRLVDELRPDIIHAHNLYSAKIVSSLKIPFVYDDHEFWSQRPRINRDNIRRPSVRRVIDRYVSWLWSEWERKIISVAPVITTSDAVAEHHRNVGQNNRVFFVPNYPSEHEIREIEPPIKHVELSSVYLGADNEKRPGPHRNVAGLSSLFRANDIGRLAWIGIEGKSDESVTYKGFLP
ncbi:MAG: glycosyltransferase, partial [Nitrososphaera sp.]